MIESNIPNDGVNETGTSCEGVSPGRCPVVQQRWPSFHHATAANARLKWSKDVNVIVMECLFLSRPFTDDGIPIRGYRQRMYRM